MPRRGRRNGVATGRLCGAIEERQRHRASQLEPPPSDYVALAQAEVASGDTLVVGVDNHPELDENDGAIALGFQLSYALALRDVHAAALATTGSGLTVEDPVRIADAEDELGGALNVIAQRNPDWQPTIGHLYRGPKRVYIMLVEFKSPTGVKPLYFDVTEWAAGFTPS